MEGVHISALFYSHGPIKPVELQDCSLPVTKERVKGLSEEDTIEELNSTGLFSEDGERWLFYTGYAGC